jgi:hypothetical protein
LEDFCNEEGVSVLRKEVKLLVLGTACEVWWAVGRTQMWCFKEE